MMNKEKILNSLLFILNKLDGKSHLHQLFKILYFADQKHLIIYGFPITWDYYIAMDHGPVPSNTYDILKAIRGDSFLGSESPEYNKLFNVDGYNVTAKVDADIEELSESEIECLIESINENKNLTFKQLVDKSHKTAWTNAKNDTNNFDNRMSIIDIAMEAEANTEILKYIHLNIENQSYGKLK